MKKGGVYLIIKQKTLLPILLVLKDDITINNSGVKIYPNPSPDIINIELTEQLNILTSIELLDLSGKILLSTEFKLEGYQLDLSGYDSGMYILVIRNNHITSTHSIVKVQ